MRWGRLALHHIVRAEPIQPTGLARFCVLRVHGEFEENNQHKNKAVAQQATESQAKEEEKLKATSRYGQKSVKFDHHKFHFCSRGTKTTVLLVFT